MNTEQLDEKNKHLNKQRYEGKDERVNQVWKYISGKQKNNQNDPNTKPRAKNIKFSFLILVCCESFSTS